MKDAMKAPKGNEIKDLMETNLDRMDTEFLIFLCLKLLPEHYIIETQKLILGIESSKLDETVRNSKIRALCKRVVRQELTRSI